MWEEKRMQKRNECVVVRGACLLLAIALSVRTLTQTWYEGISGRAPTVRMLLDKNKSYESRTGAIVLWAASLLLSCLKLDRYKEVLRVAPCLYLLPTNKGNSMQRSHGTGLDFIPAGVSGCRLAVSPQ